ncbi:MAG TPA: PemK family transcriptional regulator [Spirochaeta sp.]|nr:PemK family transcriptional regulator [Spirochaeta sp.]
MNRGDIRWYKFKYPDKKRPVLILTRDSVIEYLNEITIAPITSTVRNIPSEVRFSTDDGMMKDCAANFDHIQTVSKAKLGALITTLAADKLDETKAAVRFALNV